MAKKISSKKLVEILNSEFNTNLTVKNLEGETYGKYSYVYFFDLQKTFGVDRSKINRLLVKNGYTGVNSNYFKGNTNMAEIPVTYRKFYGWNE